MRLYKRGRYYWASWTEGGSTVRRSTRTGDKGAARLVVQRWEREHADPDYAAAATATLGEAVKRFIEQHTRGKAAGTASMYRQKSGHLLRLIGESTLLAAITARVVDDYVAARRTEGVAFDDEGKATRFVTSYTIQKELVALRGVLKYAKRRGEFPRDIKSVMPIGFAHEYEPRKRFLTLEQAQKLCGALEPHRAAVVAFILATSARQSEALEQLRADVKIAEGSVVVRGTKTDGSWRAVPVMPFVKPLLEFAEANGTGKGEKLFAPWPSMRRDIIRACRRAGVPDVTSNDLRRTLATWLIERGVPNHVVAKVLGHVDTKMVDKVYGQMPAATLAALATQYLAASSDQRAAVPPAYQHDTIPAHSADGADAVTAGNHELPALPSGDLEAGGGIKSPQLYRLSYRPAPAEKPGERVAEEADASAAVPPVYQVPSSTGRNYAARAKDASVARASTRSFPLERAVANLLELRNAKLEAASAAGGYR